MKILFIHGRDQQEKDEAELKGIWQLALEESFNLSRLTKPENLKLDFPYFGNQLIALQKEYQDKIDKGEYQMRSEGNSGDPAGKLEQDLLEEIVNNAGIDRINAVTEFGPDYLERGPLNHRFPIALIRAIDNWVSPVGNYSIRKVTSDVAAYLIVGFIRKDINDFIKGYISKEPTIIIAHSLGTVIAYDILSSLSTNSVDIKGLITLGSPLGVKAIKRQFSQGIKWPDCVTGDWLNIYDSRDID